MADNAVGRLFSLYLTKMIENERNARCLLEERDSLTFALPDSMPTERAEIERKMMYLDPQIDHFIKRVEMYARLVEVTGKRL